MILNHEKNQILLRCTLNHTIWNLCLITMDLMVVFCLQKKILHFQQKSSTKKMCVFEISPFVYIPLRYFFYKKNVFFD